MNATILTSPAWCDLVFTNKNKEYGAYVIRMDSSKRHVSALLIVIVLSVLGFFLSNWFNKSLAQTNTNVMAIYSAVEFDNLNDKPENPEEKIIIPPTPVVPIVASVKFVAPVITPDDQVRDEDLMQAQIELTQSSAVIAGVTHEGNTDGPGSVITDVEQIEAVSTVDNTVHLHVEQMPSYPGGEAELMAFLKNNLKYPVIAQEVGIQGTVTLRFVVNKDGSVGDIQILRSLDASCDKEALRVVGKMGSWIPGKQNGLPVRVYYTLPVRFRLASN